MRMLFVCGDRGGFNAVMPVIELARREGHSVFLHLSAGTTTWSAQQENTLHIPTGVNLVGAMELSSLKPSCMIVGSSASLEGSQGACNAIQQVMPTHLIMVQDYLQSGQLTMQLVHQSGLGFHAACVDSEFSRKCLSESTMLRSDLIFVTGTPQYDSMRKEAMSNLWGELKAQIRAEVPNDCFLMLLAGQLNGTSELITLALHGAFAAGLRDPDQFRLIIRAHPRATELDKIMVTQTVTGMMSRYIYSPSKLCDVKRTEDILPALEGRKGLVLSGYSSTNIAACICNIDAVCAGTPSFRHDFAQEKFPDTPYKAVPFPLEAENGAAWRATSAREMSEIIAAIRSGAISGTYGEISQGRARMAELNDGNSAKRILANLVAMES